MLFSLSSGEYYKALNITRRGLGEGSLCLGAYATHQPAALCSCRKRPELASLGLEEFDEDLEDTVAGALEQMLKPAAPAYQHIPPGFSSQPCEDQFAIYRDIGNKRHCAVDFCSIEAYRCSVGREQFEIETNEGALW